MNTDFELLEEQIKDNNISWYPFEENKQYEIIKELTKQNEDELKSVVSRLKEDGKILIFIDNKLAMKNICLYNYKQNFLYNKREIEELLDKYGLKFRKFYYLLPDAKMTNVIFTDKHLPDNETISRNIGFYDDEVFLKNTENYEYKKILSQDRELFKIFANAYLVECSKNEFKDNEIEFVSFSNMRKEEYRIKTIIKGDYVYKDSANKKSEKHIDDIKKNIDILNNVNLKTLDSYNKTSIISKYQKDGKTLDKVLKELILDKQKDEAKQIIEKLINELKEKLIIVDKTEKNVFDLYNIEYNKDEINNLTFIKYGLWDLIFQNIFYIDNQYYFYDQEWMEKNIPIEFIIFRSFIYSQDLAENILLNDVWEYFNITEENIGLFQKLDIELQKKTRDEIAWKLNSDNGVTQRRLIEKIETLEADKQKISQDCRELLIQKDNRIRDLEENLSNTINNLKQKEQELEIMKKSKSWKITEPLRKLRGEKSE